VCARVYAYSLLCILDIITYVYTLKTHACLCTRCVDIKSRFFRIGYGTLLRRMRRVLLFLLSSLKLGYQMIRVCRNIFRAEAFRLERSAT